MENILNNVKKVCCQGTKGAYSHIACMKLFPEIQPLFVKNFEDVFISVCNGSSDAGILPVENSTAGLVGGIIDFLVKYNINIVYAKTINISHVLCAKKGTNLSDIKKIYSQYQALLQCSEFLKTAEAEVFEAANTAIAANFASKNTGCAAICSPEAAKLLDLDILKENICNNKVNQTRFIVISKENFISDNANITSLFFKIKNKSGSLFNVLKMFAEYNVNLSSLHSIPLEDEIWNYGFYADIEGSANSENIKDCINSLKENLQFLRVLGSYKSEN